jgi:acyl CoA:acetate/3-ketoacid CoA transferase alpha subunit/acyl CoA:acetate/3-ketoacid CoA transferase beta subunit
MKHMLDDPIFQPGIIGDSFKVMSLHDAVKCYVKPKMMLHTCQTGIRWCTAIYNEIARQFWGKNTEITLAGISMNFPQAILVHGKIVNKMITSYFGDPYFVPSPNRVIQRAYKEGALDIEHWSIYTLTLRFQAAAMGLPFLPSHSLVGSSMEKDNAKDIIIMDYPDRKGEKISLVKGLQPDLSVVHAWLADPEGNAVFIPPLAENVSGAMASKEGVLLTVEKIVPTETLRKYSHMVKLPGIYVKSVSEVPFGAHPSGMSQVGMNDYRFYSEDYAFVDKAHQEAKSDATFEEWIDKWVLSCKDHNDYLAKLGHDRINLQTGQTDTQGWKTNFSALKKIKANKQYASIEMAMVVMSRVLQQKIIDKGHQTLLAGAGIANLASWLCFYMLKEKKISIELMAEIGMFGYTPCPTEPVLFNSSNFATCKVTTDIPTIMGLFVGGINANCIGALGAAQIDEHGNINSTKVDEKTVMVGSGGANDVCSAAKDIVVIIPQSKKRLLKDVYYITSPGKHVSTIVSTLGVFEKKGSDKVFTLTGYFPSEEKDVDMIMDKFRQTSGWSFNIADDLKEIDPPTEKEITMLRIFDPDRFFLGALE